ncbi:hypothetical protein IW252_002413 [Zhihengliuella flava]|uniref:Uncharacterized protein n=1 Tax=Zhihengliuella flava TaxID=1285193 RepID=A0A931DDU9_9MICC|nr:hypothetical protein [Zhihengliuella flava]
MQRDGVPSHQSNHISVIHLQVALLPHAADEDRVSVSWKIFGPR